jgi:hypothetical protein
VIHGQQAKGSFWPMTFWQQLDEMKGKIYNVSLVIEPECVDDTYVSALEIVPLVNLAEIVFSVGALPFLCISLSSASFTLVLNLSGVNNHWTTCSLGVIFGVVEGTSMEVKDTKQIINNNQRAPQGAIPPKTDHKGLTVTSSMSGDTYSNMYMFILPSPLGCNRKKMHHGSSTSNNSRRMFCSICSHFVHIVDNILRYIFVGRPWNFILRVQALDNVTLKLDKYFVMSLLISFVCPGLLQQTIQHLPLL